MVPADALAAFSEPTRAWFTTSFPEPTPAQAQGWPAIAEGGHTLILAPTGSGKTLTAFLWSLDRLMAGPPPESAVRTRVLYVSPLRALAVDVDRNLRSPLRGIALAAERLGQPCYVPEVGIRTGDTSTEARRRLARHPPDILITTPESLYLVLTSRARETLVGVDTVIVDEIHAVAATKRGAHLAVTLERLERVTARPPQRIGLSATQRPLEEIARFLGGFEAPGRPRPVSIVDAGSTKALELEVVVPTEDLGSMGTPSADEAVTGPAAGIARRSIWPSMHPRLVDLVRRHRSTIIFVNARRLAERLASRLNELWAAQEEADGQGGDGDGGSTAPGRVLAATAGEAIGTSPAEEGRELVKAHHGSLSRERRLLIEDELKRGELRGLVATSSLELGIDMGAVDLVVQVESPGAVARGLQRVGRAGHQVGEPSRGKIFPKHRADLLEAAVVVEGMLNGRIEATRYPRNPLDVAAQQLVAMTAMDDWTVADLAGTLRGAANFAELSDEQLRGLLDLLAGRYPSERFAELRPRIVWDRVADVVTARPGAQRLAVTNPGTIPDRGLFGVFLPDGTRVGELDEEMVYESRPGETFLLGATTWRIEDITFERVVVTPAPGQPGKMPFWHGDGPGRPVELGQAMGAMVRELRQASVAAAGARLTDGIGLDRWAADNLLRYLDEQAEATGVVPDDRTIVVERFRDEIGDWRVCVLSPFGARVHAPWAMALRHRLREAWGVEIELMWSDDGIVVRLPEAVDELPLDALAVEPEDVDELVVSELPGTALFAGTFRECAARALLLPRRRPDQRTPLWQQRQRAADLLAAAAEHPTFPILLETTRECLNDVFDLPALRHLLTDLRSRRIRLVPVDTAAASPFASSLLFGWIAVYMYEGDAPLAERRAAALALDRDLLRDLLGAEELRELIDPGALAQLEAELQRLGPDRHARRADDLWDLLRRIGPLTRQEVDARSSGDTGAWMDELLRARRIIEVSVAGVPHLAAAEDAGRLRDALGVALPLGLPAAFTDSVDRPLDELVARYAHTHGPFAVAEPAARFGLPASRVVGSLEALERQGRLTPGEFRPGGAEREWCDVEVLRQLRRRSLAALRREVEPVDAVALGRFLPAWQGVGGSWRGVDGLVDALGALQGAAMPASTLESDVLAARVRDYRPADLDALCTAGDLMWVGNGALGANDGRIRLAFRDQASLLLGRPAAVDVGEAASAPDVAAPAEPATRALLDHLAERGASFWADLVGALAARDLPYDDATTLAALWDLVWSGLVTNDSLAPLRAHLRGARVGPARGSATGVAGGPAGERAGGPAGGSGAAHGGWGRPRGRASLPRSRPRPGRLSRIGPPAGAGRWSLVAPQLGPAPPETEAATARAFQLLDRYGILTRETALGEGIEGGFAGVYPVLKALEERGQVRRGYFVAGLGAAQFALPGAVERLRSYRADPDDPDDPAGAARAATGAGVGPGDDLDLGPGREGGDGGPEAHEVLVLAATDPAQPYGAALAWPPSAGRPARAAGAHVVLARGEVVAYLERSGRTLLTFPAAAARPGWASAFRTLLERRSLRKIEITRIDGDDPAASPAVVAALHAAGFAPGYRGPVLRR